MNLGTLSAAERFKIIHDEIRHRICFLIYAPGQQLSETALASEFGISRTPVRSVLAQLEAEGLIEIHQGAATRVTQIELDALRDEYELRMNLAELAGQMGLIPSTERDLADLRQVCADLEELTKNPKSIGYAKINLNFHNILLRRVRNPSLQTLIDRMYFRTSRIWLSKIPYIDWQNEISNFIIQVKLMLEMFKINDDRGTGLLQRHIIYTSLRRFVRYGESEEL
ncbi:GntR family transcriptional regulator [Rhizobium mongolense]|uniref:DNA-binding GntR family transcriptional regulator n=1 Tax=Rhizobium mongolense TaxID=57676 RepID=A0A7W6RRE1_9HYPH|nr:GntR family transcriptional regulator [Rhizobium mongolense]MBB4276691.1 DNA-binding GntR family transcriptional regulator [Rhizobium mongolense]